MRELFDNRNCRNVEGVSGVGLIGADSALAHNNLVVAACHDVLGTHQPFLNRRAQSALKQNRLVGLAELLEQVKVLHISRADLDNVYVLEHINVLCAHNLGDDGQSGLLPRDFQQVKSLGLQALKGVG